MSAVAFSLRGAYPPAKGLAGALLAVLLTVGLGKAGLAAEPDTAPIQIGVLAVLDDQDTHQQWQPLRAGLAAALPQHRFELHSLGPEDLERQLAAGQLAFVITNPGHYVLLEARYGATRIATQTAAGGVDPAHAVGSAMVMKADRLAPTDLDGLRGLRVAAVSEGAFGGYQLVAAQWARLGLNPESGDIKRVFTGYPMTRVLDTLMQGQADVAILRTCLLERWIREGRVAEGLLQVVAVQADARLPCQSSTPLYPGWAFAAARAVQPAVAREVAISLLSLPPDPQGTQWSVPADYQRVHDVLRTLEVEPYAFLRATRLEALARRYWYVLGGALAVLALGALYALRVEALVRRRTSELTRSIQERDRLALEIERDHEAMDHLSRLSILGELSATLGHELNQPLATIANYAASVQRRAANGSLSSPALQQALQDIGSEAERAAHILEGIRALARKRLPQRKLCDPVQLVQEAMALFRALQVHAPDVRLQVDTSSQGWQVQVDPLQIQQVLLNLLKNAMDAHRAAGLDALPVTCCIHAVGGQVCIGVADQGPPLSEDQRMHLFEPFFTTKPDGLGLGLPICRTIVEAHGGAMNARPVADPAQAGGMLFEMWLPGQPQAGATPPPATQEHP